MTKITVITLTYNRGKYNIPSIKSILSQTYQNFHYLVVNDGSTDNTKEILNSIKHPNLTVIHQENKGFTNSLVDVLQTIETPYVAIHGAGDISHPERLEKQIKLLESDKLIGAVGCHVQRISNQGKILHKWKLQSLMINSLEELFVKYDKSNYFRHGEVMFPYWAYQKAGGYRRFFTYTQDYDLWLRMLSFSKLAKVDAFLYEQVNIPGSSINCDYKKTEIQAKMALFAYRLAQQRLRQKFDDLDLDGIKAFEKFEKTVSPEDKTFISNAVMITAEGMYKQNNDYKTILGGYQRALDIDSNNIKAKKGLKLAYLARIVNSLGLKKMANQIYNPKNNLYKKILKKINYIN